jgi:cytochrome P450
LLPAAPGPVRTRASPHCRPAVPCAAPSPAQEGAALAPRLPLEVAFTPFGAGARLCIGYRFAQQEATIALVRLFQRFTFDLEPGMVPLRTAHHITLSPKDGVRCRVAQRA